MSKGDGVMLELAYILDMLRDVAFDMRMFIIVPPRVIGTAPSIQPLLLPFMLAESEKVV
jgi:hypothetical protein